MNDEDKTKHLSDLEKSPGWAIAKEALLGDYSYRVTLLAKNRSMSKEDIEFSRGVIYAVEFLSNLPTTLKKRIENERTISNLKKMEKN